MAVLVAVERSEILDSPLVLAERIIRNDSTREDGFWKSPSYTVGFSDKVHRCSDVGAASSHIGDEKRVYRE